LRCRLIANTTAASAAAGLSVNQTVTVNALTRTDMGFVANRIASMTAGQSATFPRPVELIVLGLPGIGPPPTPTPTPTPAPLQLTTAVSRKTHGDAGDFDINLPLTGEPGVECRTGAAGHTLIFTFNNNVVSGSASVTSGIGSVSGSATFSGTKMTVSLIGVTDVQMLGVTLSGVTDNFSQVLANTTVNTNFLLGDSTGNKSVNASDVVEIKSQSGAAVTAANFRTDLNANGAISASDVSQAKATSGNSIP